MHLHSPLLNMIILSQIALRWRVEKEVVEGKGQFTCGNKRCHDDESEGLRSWEVNFAYVEHGEKKNALVKLSEYNYGDYGIIYNQISWSDVMTTLI